jgi:hypothetical protein
VSISKLHVSRIDISGFLMWALLVPVVHEFFVISIDSGSNGVGLAESLDLADSAWPPLVCEDALGAFDSTLNILVNDTSGWDAHLKPFWTRLTSTLVLRRSSLALPMS